MNFVTQWASETWLMLLASGPWLLGGFAVAGMVHLLLPREKVVAHLGVPGLKGVLKAALIGVPLPLCSCSVIPVASSIRQRGAGRGATASFLISTPETGVDSIAISYALLGPFFAVARPIVAFVTAIVAGLLVDRVPQHNEQASLGALPVADSTCSTGHCCCGNEAANSSSMTRRLLEAIRYGLVDMFTDLSPWLVSGFLLAGLVGAIVPEGFLESRVGSGWSAMLLMAVVGLPMYVCATASTPIAAALIVKGLSPGAALVFLLVGPATNLATMLIVGKELGRRSLAVYLITIVAFALLFGWLTDLLIGHIPMFDATPMSHDHESASVLGILAGVALIALTANGLRLRLARGKPTSDLTAA